MIRRTKEELGGETRNDRRNKGTRDRRGNNVKEELWETCPKMRSKYEKRPENGGGQGTKRTRRKKMKLIKKENMERKQEWREEIKIQER